LRIAVSEWCERAGRLWVIERRLVRRLLWLRLWSVILLLLKVMPGHIPPQGLEALRHEGLQACVFK
jgi:hypothetical protein